MKVFRHFAYAQLRGAILVLQRYYGIREADGCLRTPPGAMLRRTFRCRCSFMYAAVSDINYIAESNASLGDEKWLGGKTVGLQYPAWLLGNIDRIK